MIKKINLLIVVFSLWMIAGFCSANTIFSDDFNSYVVGSGLNGQGGWVSNGTGFQVQRAVVKEGTKAISKEGISNQAIKEGIALNDGTITFYIRKDSTGVSNYGDFELWQSPTNKTGGILSVRITTFNGNNGIFYVNSLGNNISFGTVNGDTWYAVQIQWRSSDHKVRYSLNGGSWTDWVLPFNNRAWTTGLGGVRIVSAVGLVSGSPTGKIYFDTIQENPIKEEKNPVLTIPGITGTELWNGDEYIWANLSRMATDVGDQFLTENLSLDENGDSLQDILSKKVIESIARDPFTVNIFLNLKSLMQTEGYELDNNLFFFPYDWRLDLNNTKELLKEEIEAIKSQTGSSKIDIIAHSMGGLLTEAYIETYGKDSIDKLIFVGTPHLGAPKAGKALLEGDDFGIPWLSEARIKELALNMPSLHQLLPSQSYFNESQGYIKPFSLSGSKPFYSYDQTKEYFLNDKNKNPIMFGKAEDFFNKDLNNLDLSGIDTYNIAGCKLSTQSAYELSFFGNIGWIGYSSGDGTVPLASSDYLNISESKKYYVKNGDHSELPSTSGVRELILDILNEQNSTLSSNISINSNFCNFKGKSLTWRSPVEVHIYDQFNNHTGPVENGVIEYGIPGVNYEIIDGEKFIFLPTDENQEYIINGIGEDDGSFDLLISEVDNGGLLGALVYNDVPIAINSKVNFSVSENSDNSVINYDFENSGQFYEIKADSVLDGTQGDDLAPPQTQISLTGKEHKDGSFISDVLVTLEAADNLSGVLETWYSLDGETFKEYVELFVLERRDVYNLYYYSVDRAGNNEEISVLRVQIGVTEQQYEKCWQDGRCSKFLIAGEKSGRGSQNVKKEFFNENAVENEIDKKINIIKSKIK